MFDNGNNQNQDDTSGQGLQNSTSQLNRQSSFNPGSSDLNYGNSFSSYNRSPSYGSYMSDSYGGINSSYGGYGGSSGYGGIGGYGGYNRSYSSYGGYGNSSYTNQYSNHYSKPLPQNQQNEQTPPPPNMRQDVWGFLNGFHAMLNVLYAATGIVHFGKIFLKMSLKIIKLICGKSIGLVFKLTGFKFLKKILMGLSTTDNWSAEFNFSDQPLENAWRSDDGVNHTTILGKIMLVLRVCSLLGTGLALFLRSKMRHQHPPIPPVQVETLGPDATLQGPQLKATDFEAVKNFYEDIRVIEEDNFVREQNLGPVLNATFEQGLQEAETFVQIVEEDEKSTIEKLSPEEEPLKVVVEESNQESPANAVESQACENKEEPVVATVEEAAESINKEEISFPIIEKIEKTFSVEPMFGANTESTKLDVTSSQNTLSTKESISSTPQDSIISEDFWKNSTTYKSIEDIQKEDKKPENTKKEFELPSVLQTLRSSSTPSSKPWLMKKKKTVEVPAETPLQTQTSQIEALEKVPEVQETPEIKTEKVTETPDVTPEVKVETQLMANLEGTTV